MKHMATRLIRKIWKTTSSKQEDNRMGKGKRKVFKGSTENFIDNGAVALEESVSLFNGKTNPISYLSVDELNTMNLEPHTMTFEFRVKWYKGLWDGKQIMVKEHYSKEFLPVISSTFREIIVSAQMSTHKNVHKLLGCCIETKYAVFVYEYVENVTLYDLMFIYKVSLDWKHRLKIAWQISHALAYLHTGFQRPIVHRNLMLQNVYLGKDDAAKLSDFSLSISVPKGKEYVEDMVVGTFCYVAPEYIKTGRVAESVDVYAFGVLFLVLVTGKEAMFTAEENNYRPKTCLRDWVVRRFENNSISEIIDPQITGDTMNNNEEVKQQLRASIGLALKCTAIEKYSRPTMVQVATELKSMIKASD